MSLFYWNSWLKALLGGTRPAGASGEWGCFHLESPTDSGEEPKKYCSIACKIKAQRTGRKSFRKGIPQARRAWGRVAYHLKTGKLKKANACESCGTTERRLEASHSDYSRPLDVRWLCKSCHSKEDWANPKNATVRIYLNSKGHEKKFIDQKTIRIVTNETTPMQTGAIEEEGAVA